MDREGMEKVCTRKVVAIQDKAATTAQNKALPMMSLEARLADDLRARGAWAGRGLAELTGRLVPETSPSPSSLTTRTEVFTQYTRMRTR